MIYIFGLIIVLLAILLWWALKEPSKGIIKCSYCGKELTDDEIKDFFFEEPEFSYDLYLCEICATKKWAETLPNEKKEYVLSLINEEKLKETKKCLMCGEELLSGNKGICSKSQCETLAKEFKPRFGCTLKEANEEFKNG